VQDYIRALYMQDLQVEEIAKNLNLDSRYLSRIFKEKTGISIKEYMIEVRMEEACQRLKAGASVSSTALFCGYTDAFNFSKMFKRKYGCSPRSWQMKN
jgi:AraC-like DNA-binding protein